MNLLFPYTIQPLQIPRLMMTVALPVSDNLYQYDNSFLHLGNFQVSLPLLLPAPFLQTTDNNQSQYPRETKHAFRILKPSSLIVKPKKDTLGLKGKHTQVRRGTNVCKIENGIKTEA